MGPVRVFLDANILFSATLGGPAFLLLWELAAARKVTLLTSSYCHLEAERNLSSKKPGHGMQLQQLMEQVQISPGHPHDIPAPMLPEKDAPVWQAAIAAHATVLVTGDRKHFGHLMVRTDLPIRVRTIKDFLLEGPARQN
jgi:predicted nucleic acid-binding protein